MNKKFSKKPRKKSAKNLPSIPPPERKLPVFLYTSKCCTEPATKAPCERSEESRENNEPSLASLGTWNCSRCQRKCKVTRTRNKVKETTDNE